MSLLNRLRFSIAVRLSLVFSLVFVVAVFIIYIYVVPQLESRLNEDKLKKLSDYATLYSDSFTNAYNQGASGLYLNLLMQQYARQADNARILFIDASGNLLGDSLTGGAFNVNDYPVTGDAIATGKLSTAVHNVNGTNTGMAAVPLFLVSNTVSNSGKPNDVIVVASSMADVDSSVHTVQRQLTIAAAAALALALAAIYIASHTLARRIRRIEKGAIQIAQGDFASRVPVTSRDELGQLAATFNDMGDRLGSAFEQIDVEKQRAKLLLDDLSEGVLGIDSAGDIIVANPAAEVLLGKELTLPVPLRQSVPEEIFDMWRSMSAGAPQREDTFMLTGEQALQVHTSFLSDPGELSSLLVLRDVSQEVKIERSRRDFIANASHELKTPLFSLGGFLEILQDEEVDEATKAEFVATMREQVDRLANLARDLLDLSRMDSGAVSVESSSLQLRPLVDSVAREFTALAGQSRIDASGLPEDLNARCDQDRTQQLVRILVDNAIKYSPEKAQVEITGAANGQTVSFTVADHGVGIPAEDVPRLFERFYRGRTAGRVRGTGLGLSIAHELVRLMNGKIEVETSSSGSAFTVTLPAGGSAVPSAAGQPEAAQL